MPSRKINDNDLLRLVRSGNSRSEIAQKLGVGPPAITKRLKALGVAIAKDITLRSAPKLVDKGLDAMAQLKRINALIHNELDYIQGSIETASNQERRELQDQKLKHVAEVRKQLSLVLDIAQVLYNVDEVKAFQEIVIEEIGNAAPEVRNTILQRLHERRAIRSTLELR
jgi:DNA-binding Lrp family transcriptional regulator